MSQPNWKCIANLGDANPVDHGGAFVFVDTTGVYPPELEIWQEPPEDSDDPENGPIDAYRVVLEPHTFIDGVLSDNPYHPSYPAWYARIEPARGSLRARDRLADVCATADTTPEDLIARLCSDDPFQRATAYQDLIAYHGVHEFDHEPQQMPRGRAEVIADRWLAEIRDPRLAKL